MYRAADQLYPLQWSDIISLIHEWRIGVRNFIIRHFELKIEMIAEWDPHLGSLGKSKTAFRGRGTLENTVFCSSVHVAGNDISMCYFLILYCIEYIKHSL